jgi:hypothetical protein
LTAIRTVTGPSARGSPTSAGKSTAISPSTRRTRFTWAKRLAPLFTKPGVWRLVDAAVAALMLALACGLLVRLL